MMAAARQVVLPGGNAIGWECTDNPRTASSPTGLFTATQFVDFAAGLAFTDTASAHTFESGYTATGVDRVGVDGVYGTGGSGASVGADRVNLSIGGIGSALTVPSQVEIALLLYFAAQPSAAQVTPATALMKWEFGY